MAIAERTGTLEEFLELPERKPALEFEEGRIIQKVSPKGKHARLETKLSELINRIVEPPKLAIAFSELRITFGGRSYVPDVAVYRRERIPRDADGAVADDFFEPPDVAVEIVSPKPSVPALIRRCLWYLEHGVGAALLADPRDRSVLVVRPGGQVTALRGSDIIDLSEIVPRFQFKVDDFYAALFD